MRVSLLEPIPVLKVWGGGRLARWFGVDWQGAVGEALICVVRGKQVSRIVGGFGAGLTLEEAAQRSTTILGRYTPDEFPIICKLIAPVNGNLSLQVHPDRDHLAAASDEPKDEVWYVVEVTKPPAVVAGLKTEPSEFLFAERKRDLLRMLDVRPSDVVRIPPGAFHSLIAGNMVLEVSTNSATTYRLWDWGRRERTLHVEEAVSAATSASPHPLKPQEEQTDYGCLCRFELPFCTIEQFDALGGALQVETGNRFALAVVLWGIFRVERHRIARSLPALLHAHSKFAIEVEQPGRLLLIRPQ